MAAPHGVWVVGHLVWRVADYVAYTLLFEPAPSIVVTCTQAQRGSSATCTAAPPPNASTVTVSEWRFESASLATPVVEAGTSLTWTGDVAISGDVRVTGEIDGSPANGDGQLTVTSRTWNGMHVPHMVDDQTPNALPEKPTVLGDLGNAGNIAQVIAAGGTWTVIQSGPNAGVLYFTGMPVEALTRIQINRVALALNSAFYFRQPAKNAPPGKCVRADVVPFLPLVEAHEGTASQPGSHAGVFTFELDNRVPQTVEPVVAQDLGELITRAETASANAISTATQLARDVINGGTVQPVPYCTFKYF